MTVLRQRMIEDMQLRGLATRTQEAYAGAVEQLTNWSHRPPDAPRSSNLSTGLGDPALA